MDPSAPQEPRRHVRVLFPVRVEFEGRRFRIDEFTDNLSEGGLFLRTDEKVSVGAQGSVTFRISRWEDPFTLRAEVVHVRTEQFADGTHPGLGIRFLELGDTDRRKLHRLVEGIRDGSVVEAIRRSLREEGGTLLQLLRSRPTDQKMVLALHARPEEIDALIRDGNPIVIERMLENPRLQLPQVRKIVRDPRMTARLLLAVLPRKQWMDDDEVRLLFCKHPRTPRHEVMALLPSLTPALLQQLIQHPTLHPEIRQGAKRLIRGTPLRGR